MTFRMRRTRRPIYFAWLLTPLLALGCGTAADAEPQAAATADKAEKDGSSALGEKWVRVPTDKKGNPLSLQTAIVRYVKAEDVKPGKAASKYDRYVDLVAAVHIADKSYYDELNRRFKKYDAVLYELVAPEGTRVPKGRGTSSMHPLGALQNSMKSMLEVEHQLEQIDYTRRNMVHADMSPAEFIESMDKKDESFAQMYFRMIGASVAVQSKATAEGTSGDLDLMAALFSKDRPRQLKIAMAKQFEYLEPALAGLNGPQGSTIINERNKRALKVLEEQLDEGVEKLAVFYGGGHLSDMHKQLEKRFGMKPVSIEWLNAWDLRP